MALSGRLADPGRGRQSREDRNRKRATREKKGRVAQTRRGKYLWYGVTRGKWCMTSDLGHNRGCTKVPYCDSRDGECILTTADETSRKPVGIFRI